MSILGPAQTVDPSQQPVKCEICGLVKPIAESFAIKVQLMAAPAEVASFECPAIAHWGCTLEHAMTAAKACVDEHIGPMHDEKAAAIVAAKAEQHRQESAAKQ